MTLVIPPTPHIFTKIQLRPSLCLYILKISDNFPSAGRTDMYFIFLRILFLFFS
nr:MAG TPA: hypothetical protein [Caudoviricetes sp.]